MIRCTASGAVHARIKELDTYLVPDITNDGGSF